MWAARCMMLALIAMLSGAAPAAAQWFHEKGEDDPFVGGAINLAFGVASSGESLVFRCTSRKDLAFLYLSIEKPMPEHVALLSLMTARLLVIVDDDPQRVYVAEIDTTPDGDRYRFTALARDLSDLADRVAAAKRRLAVAVELNGERLYSTAVGVRGSRAAISKLVSGCKLGD